MGPVERGELSERAGFTVRWAYVATWVGMTPNILPIDNTQLNNYQAMVVGDADHMKMAVLYFYQDKGENFIFFRSSLRTCLCQETGCVTYIYIYIYIAMR